MSKSVEALSHSRVCTGVADTENDNERACGGRLSVAKVLPTSSFTTGKVVSKYRFNWPGAVGRLNHVGHIRANPGAVS